ncbi:uncharacterized [Tachysurus ichikawai]
MPRVRLLGASRHVVGVKAKEPQQPGAEIRHHPHSPPVMKSLTVDTKIFGGVASPPPPSGSLLLLCRFFLSRHLGPFVSSRRDL